LFAEGARIVEMVGGTARELQRPARHYYLASNRSAGIGLAVDPVTGAVSGVASKDGEQLQITGDFVSGLQFEEIAEAEDVAFSCGNGEHDLSLGAPPAESRVPALSASASAAGEAITYQAVVAVDTDTEWLAGFKNAGDASEWIADLFLAMNVLYERDVETRLLIGDVFLRTGSDPYSPNPDTFAKLNEFGEHWMENMDHVDRQFATMFSGRNISPGWFSGIAWVDQYCENGSDWGTSVPGSYSYNAIGSGFSAAAAAHFVGHELGHNMGSPHTHCYSQPLDQCYSGETFNYKACYSGPTACPADGSGTVMSYCHGLAGCDSDTEFHPTVQATLENRLASELVAGCIMPYTEEPYTRVPIDFLPAPCLNLAPDGGHDQPGPDGPGAEHRRRSRCPAPCRYRSGCVRHRGLRSERGACRRHRCRGHLHARRDRGAPSGADTPDQRSGRSRGPIHPELQRTGRAARGRDLRGQLRELKPAKGRGREHTKRVGECRLIIRILRLI
jgi:hypothetical protein